MGDLDKQSAGYAIPLRLRRSVADGRIYEPLFEFRPGEGFPDGSVHMRNFPLHIADAMKAQQVIESFSIRRPQRVARSSKLARA